MTPQIYVCTKCHTLFDMTDFGDGADGKCPNCGSSNAEMFNITLCPTCPDGPPAWQYKCQECEHEFQMPVPSGPTEERSRTCPECNSKNIKVLNILKSEVCPPGG